MRIDNPSKKTINGRTWREKHKHPCQDCGKSCGPTATRCMSCASKMNNAPQRKETFCIDCGRSLSRRRGLRCRSCYSKSRRMIQRFDGKHQTLLGYIKVGTTTEHKIVWEQANGPLPENWVIHHINGKRDDNRLKNLVALSKGKHHYALLLQSKDKRIQQLEAQLRKQGQLL